MDAIFYHFQDIIYNTFWMFLGVRTLLNILVHQKTDSYIYHLEEFEGYGQLGDPERRYKSQSNEQLILYLFTFWWVIKSDESLPIRRLKRVANTLNILFLIMALSMLVFFLHMQEVNHIYRYVEQDPWQYFSEK